MLFLEKKKMHSAVLRSRPILSKHYFKIVTHMFKQGIKSHLDKICVSMFLNGLLLSFAYINLCF